MKDGVVTDQVLKEESNQNKDVEIMNAQHLYIIDLLSIITRITKRHALSTSEKDAMTAHKNKIDFLIQQ